MYAVSTFVKRAVVTARVTHARALLNLAKHSALL